MNKTKGFFVILLAGLMFISFVFYQIGYINGYSDCGEYSIDMILKGYGGKDE